MPQKLELQLAQFRSESSLGISYTNESIIDHQGNLIKKKVLTFQEQKNRGYVFEHLVFDNFIPISSVMIRKELFLLVGEFDPHYHLAEDYDFLLKAVRKYPVDYIDKPLLLYREHRESGTHKKIDAITLESFSILHEWKSRDPSFFQRHFFQYFLFWLKS
jgi:hypothetical protein